jgi:hypothetical protein
MLTGIQGAPSNALCLPSIHHPPAEGMRIDRTQRPGRKEYETKMKKEQLENFERLLKSNYLVVFACPTPHVGKWSRDHCLTF